MIRIPVSGDLDSLTAIFQALAHFFQSEHPLFQCAAALGALFAVMHVIGKPNLLFFAIRWFFKAILIANLIFYSKTEVVLSDPFFETERTISNVPTVLAWVANFSTQLSSGLTLALESVFEIADPLKYSQTGLLAASRLMAQSKQFVITDRDYALELDAFVNHCVFENPSRAKGLLQRIATASDPWVVLMEDLSADRAFVSTTSGYQVCAAGGEKLQRQWDNIVSETQIHYAHILFPENTLPHLNHTALASILDPALQFLVSPSVNTHTWMSQVLLLHVLEKQIPRLEQPHWGALILRFLPTFKTLLEGLLYGSFIGIALLLLTPIGFGLLKYYVGALFWLQLWSPLYAMINFIMLYSARSISPTDLSLGNLERLLNAHDQITSITGGLALLVPFLSWGVFRCRWAKGSMS